jgi:general secretion pathway protein D
MEISVESSGVGGEQTVGGQTYPSFTTRTARTSAMIESGKTLVLGGIIYERGGSTRAGIPFLSRIPIIGALFGNHSYFKDKAELIIMVTPHVISNTEEALELTRQYQNRVKTIRSKIDFLRVGGNKTGKVEPETK